MTVNKRHFPRVPFFQSDMVQGGLRHRNFRQLLTEALKVFRRQGHRQHLSTSTGIHQPNRFSRDAQWGLGFQRFCVWNHGQSAGIQLSERRKASRWHYRKIACRAGFCPSLIGEVWFERSTDVAVSPRTCERSMSFPYNSRKVIDM